MRKFFSICVIVSMLCGNITEAKDNRQIKTLENQFFNAVKNNKLSVIEQLLHSKDKNKLSKAKDKALILAIQRNNVNIVKVLLDACANPNEKTSDGKSALMLAVEKGYTQIVQMLIKNKAEIDNRSDPDAPCLIVKDAVLLVAVHRGYKDIVNSLLKAGADANAKDFNGRSVLMFAAKQGYLEIVNLLLDAKANVNAKDNFGSTALTFTAEMGNYSVAKTLIDRGADVNADKGAALRIVSLVEDEERFKILSLMLNKKVKVNNVDDNGATPLMLAAQYNEMACPLLIKARADLKAKDKEGYSVLDYAYMGGREKNIQLLRKKGATTNKIKSQ